MSKGADRIFRPLWVRAMIVVACAAWALVEWANGQTGWALLAAAVTAYGVWSFFIAWRPDDETAANPHDKE
ncbi:DUF3329 domain-containing protein [Mesorhizobium xinjiangense]|uniref:DUF3329 domain-containing protein n=1 Tax=Mesorhizobium xinjiangense TaxID=2678685 RepID=UPI0012ED0821|nr:DUF3329 domain-containing protein [Mesorhizobium xinjiangense]